MACAWFSMSSRAPAPRLRRQLDRLLNDSGGVITADFSDDVLRVHIPKTGVQSARLYHASRGGSSWRRTFNKRRDGSG